MKNSLTLFSINTLTYRHLLSIIALLISAILPSYAQDDLLDKLEKAEQTQKVYVMATFKGTRIINGHTTETLKKKHLDYIVSHRFGAIDLARPLYDFIGMDAANTRMAFEYGLNDNFTIGTGRNSLSKVYDIYGKLKLIKQAKGPGSSPLSMTAFGSVAISTEDTSPQARYYTNTDRFSYTTQLLIARKFNDKLSLQIVPSFVYRNRTLEANDKQDNIAIGFGGRYKLSKRIALCGEYYYLLDQTVLALPNNQQRYNSASLGIDIETGGHVFQLHFSNSQSMIEKQFITENKGTNGQELHFGFNISRSFSLDKRAKGQFK